MTEPYDEPRIGNDGTIIRRIDPIQHLVPDANSGRKRISSKAFQPSSQSGMSVDIERLILEAGLEPRAFVTTPRFQGSVWFAAGAARQLGLRAGYDPIEGTEHVPPNPYHGEVWGSVNSPNKFTNAQKRGLHQAVEWYVELTGVSIR